MTDSQGQIRQVQLCYAAQTPIKRHIKIKAQANPFDPQWEIYFERPLETKMQDELAISRKARSLWQAQKGLCPVCQQKITTQTGWHSHHITWRTHGGKDTLENQVLLHPTCHYQVHSQGLAVVKPRPLLGV